MAQWSEEVMELKAKNVNFFLTGYRGKRIKNQIKQA